MDAKEVAQAMNRRHFLKGSGTGLGALALSSLVGEPQKAIAAASAPPADQYVRQSHFHPKAKRIIYLFQSGAPSLRDIFGFGNAPPRQQQQSPSRAPTVLRPPANVGRSASVPGFFAR